MPTSPAASTTSNPPMPARSAPKKSMNMKNSHGARNATARPVVVYRPNATPSLPSAVILSSRVRAADWVGPMNRPSISPHTQNASTPDRDSSVSPAAIIAASDPTMTGLDPTWSSSRPPSTAPTAATVLALIPNSSTSACETPYTRTPRTAPNANTPDSPSRNTALASRK